jgi:hypothetical protein
MKINENTFEYNGEEYQLVFDINVMQDIQEEFGSFDEWGRLSGADTKKDENGNEILDENGQPISVEPNAKAVLRGLTFMINEGIDIYNEKHGTDRKPLTFRQVGRMMTEISFQDLHEAMQKTVIEATESEEKNV